VFFQQVATGSFSVEVSGCCHCGPDDSSPKKFDFRVEIEFHGSPLDVHGFLLDNLSFMSYFNSIGTLDYSCELLAMTAAKAFWRMAGRRCRIVRVSIWGIPGAAMVKYVLDCDPDMSPFWVWVRRVWQKLTGGGRNDVSATDDRDA
jgi:hypothetical protein